MKKNKLLIAGISAAAVVLFSASGYTVNAYSKISKFNNLIYPNVKIQNVDVGGKTKEEAKELLTGQTGSLSSNQKITATNEGKEYLLDLSNVKISYDIDQAINEAFNFGKDQSFIQKYKDISKESGANITLKYSVDDSVIDNYIGSIKSDINKDPINAKVSINNGQPQAVQEVNGKKVNEIKLKEDIKNLISVHKDAADTVPIEVESVSAKITTDAIKSIDTLVSSFTTNFGSSSSGRAANIALAAQTISGTTLLPGDTFSFNNIVGDTTADKGYKPAGVIIGDKIQQDYGGGVCQVSTTLYNAIMKINLRATERHPHNLPVSYVPLGTDAAISYGSLDFQFKNTFNSPVYIEACAGGGSLTFNIYSNSSVVDSSKIYKLRNEVYDTISPTPAYVDDPSLKEGEQKVIQSSNQGYKARAYLDVLENGVLKSSEQVSNDTYSAVNGKIAKGTKKEEKPETKPQTKPETKQDNQTVAKNEKGAANQKQQ